MAGTGVRTAGYALARVDPWLAAWFALWCVVYAAGGGMSWHFFVQGQRALSDVADRHSGGLHLYAGLPQLQIGPFTLFVTWLISPFGAAVSLHLAQVLGAAAGVAILLLARAAAQRARPDLAAGEIARRTRWAAVFFLPVWLYLAVGSVHLDDVLAILFGVLATYTALREQALLTGVLLGLAVDSKPWALPFAAILLILVGNRRRASGFITFAATVAACWAPFLIADPHTLNAVHFTIANTPRTALRILGIRSPRTPWWDRPAQSALGIALAFAGFRHGRWAALILVTVAARLVLDPGTNLYYPAGLVAGAALWDIAGSPLRRPWWTATAAATLFAGRHLGLPPGVNGWLTLGYFGACALLVLIPARGPEPKAPVVQEELRRSSKHSSHETI